MAVIQISRIQQRRGQKLATGIPQLSSAELAWAVDTQELFIGNGSVAEGAPYVGNTRILTEHSNIFEDAVYQFMPTVMGNSVPRKAQDKLDEYVSILDFVEKDQNGIISWADTFEAAIHDLFLSSNHNYRKVLTIPNGTYKFNRYWSLQSGVILRGESQDNVVLDMGKFAINSGSVSDVKLQNFTITGSGPVFNLTGLTHSLIENVTVTGTYLYTVPEKWYVPSVVWSNLVNSNKTDYVDFLNCRFDTVNTAVLVTQTTAFETNINFYKCSFTNSFRGVAIDGVVGQSNRWVINDCLFSDIYDSAIIVSHGKNTLIRNSAFYRCGNRIGTAETPYSIIILFGDIANNLVVDCSCDRRSAVARSVSLNTEAIPDAENTSRSTFVDYTNIDLVTGNKNVTAFSTFSSTTDYIIIEYGVSIGAFTRTGELHVTVGDLTANPQSIAVIDNYSHASAVYNPNSTDLTQQFELGVSPTSTRNSVVLTYTNGSGSSGVFVYKVTFGSVQSVVVPTQFQAIPGNHVIYISWDPYSSPNGSSVDGYSLIITAAVNHKPIYNNLLMNQYTAYNTPFAYTFAANTFTDVDYTPLTYTATLADGLPLPNWLSLNSGSRTFSGTPIDTTDLNVKVIASDGSLTADGLFTIAIRPGIKSIAITSATGAHNGYLNAGDVVTSTVTFSEMVFVTGNPRLALNIGGTTVQATFTGGSGTDNLTFNYTILSGQSDTNGISFDENALSLNGSTIVDTTSNYAVITSSAVSNNPIYKVDMKPVITSIAITHATRAQSGYLNAGDVVTSTVTFSEMVNVTGNPTLALNIGGTTVQATFTGGSGTDSLTFEYVILSGQSDTNGISFDANALSLNGATIEDVNTITADITSLAVSDNPNYKVDMQPVITNIAITSVTGAQNGYLNAGDVVTSTVTFNEIVTVTGSPLLALNIGGTIVQATFTGGSGTNALTFNYTILAGQTDTNGISFDEDAVIMNGASILDSNSNTAIVSSLAVSDNANCKVDTTAPATPNAPTTYVDNVGNIQSTNSTSATTDDTTPGINVGSGLIDTPKLYVDGSLVASIYNLSSGTLTPSNALAFGTYSFAYTLTDIAGNESLPSQPIVITIANDQWPPLTIGGGDDTRGYWLGTAGDGSKMIVAPKSTDVRMEWGSFGYNRGVTSTTDGVTNTNTLYGFGYAAHPAAYTAKSLTTGGYNSWYLPAKDELRALYSNSLATPFATNNSFESAYYWSSTEYSNAYAYYHTFNSNGTEGYSSKSNVEHIRAIRRVATVPTSPIGVSATAGDAQAIITFTLASNGGSAISGYTVISSPGNITATGANTSITVTGLTNGTAYTFTVTATNAVGTSAPSSASNSVTPTGIPFATIGSGSDTAGYWLGTAGDGTSKLIVAPKSTEVIKTWDSYGTARNTISTTDGVSNTNTLYGFGSAAHPAAYHAKSLTTGGYNNWYLPAKDELNSLWSNHLATPFSANNGFATSLYWSSTELDALGAWYQGFNDGTQNTVSGKTSGMFVRATRRY